MRKIAVFLLILLLTGCGGVPFAVTEPAPVPAEVTPEQLAASVWTQQSGIFLVRQTVLFEFRGARVPMSGMLRLDASRGRARLVAMNDLGVKLFDLEVSETTQQQHYLLSDLSRIPHFAEAVATSVRRVFLAPRPDGSERLTRSPRLAELRRPFGSGDVCFTFGGGDTRLLMTVVADGEESWRIRYFEYQKKSAIDYPRGVVLEDRMAGYRLTLWQEEVKRIDE